MQNGLLVQLGKGNKRGDISADPLAFEQIIKIGTQGGQLAHYAAFMVAQHLLLLHSFSDGLILVIQR